jgi:serine/threonine-protein kinase HipA
VSDVEALSVYSETELIGLLQKSNDGSMTFTYDPGWLSGAHRFPLAQSLPLVSEPVPDAVCRPFFAGVLPEERVRGAVARRLGVSADNDFEMLVALGGDCAGAITLFPAGEDPPTPSNDCLWLDEDELAKAIRELPTRPFLLDESGHIRLSLAGAQDKLPVFVRDEQVGVPLGASPSSHILKAEIQTLVGTVHNEAFCLQLATRLGLRAATASIGTAGDQTYLLVTRYDRESTNAFVRRLHQEDFCQALGISPRLKYESEGGPGVTECVELIREAIQPPAPSVLEFVDAVAFNVLIGNMDAHGKNYSLLYPPGTSRPAMAPLYDLVCTRAYPDLSRHLAMRVGGVGRPENLRRRHWEALAREAQLGVAQVVRRVHNLASRAGSEAATVGGEMRNARTYSPILDEVIRHVVRTANHVAEETA